ncbi:hypothetical protein KK137_07585 [Croceibacterium sp. LX-88]|uniref:Uncharacterized protein n=1 Tax=Croceibacterium selenioxidans TaxID=2838833 RepID=A0ABS5W4H3_9SPHN|nr:hypothetical protein [Croceibacterium selenioxidans]MBT2134188.1 hypothetical protein [Croceibacterium selenioxidans]
MRGPFSILRGTALAVALAIPLSGALAQAQTTPGTIPRQADGKPDFSGVWQTLSEADYDLEPHAGRRDAPPSAGVVDGSALPYRPEALAQKKANFDKRGEDDPRLKCWTLGVPRSVYYPAPFQIFQHPEELTLVHQLGHQVRTIFTDGSLHPEHLEEGYWLGDSRGHWEGDTLVVDVNHFNGETWFDRAGAYHGEALHVVEKWAFVDANTVSYSATVEDPDVYTRPWTVSVLLNRRRDPGFELIEDYCFTLPYEPHYPHKDVTP